MENAKPSDHRTLPAAQRANIEQLFKIQDEIAENKAKLHDSYERRHQAMLRIFDEIAKNPSIYTHVKSSDHGETKQSEPMTLELLRGLRQKYEVTLRPVLISGPGCDDPPACANKPDCVCVFSVGTLCCYVCLSPGVIQCTF